MLRKSTSWHGLDGHALMFTGVAIASYWAPYKTCVLNYFCVVVTFFKVYLDAQALVLYWAIDQMNMVMCTEFGHQVAGAQCFAQHYYIVIVLNFDFGIVINYLFQTNNKIIIIKHTTEYRLIAFVFIFAFWSRYGRRRSVAMPKMYPAINKLINESERERQRGP
jgi:hypothetical protein